MISWPLRIAGWLVGIYALLKLATVTGTVTYTKVFQGWMDSLRDIVDLGFLLTPLKVAVVLPALDFIRSLNIPVPPLQDHWQQVFVLMWLMSAARARNSFFGTKASVSLPAAFFILLPFCVAAGTLPVYSAGVFLWPIAGFFAFYAILALGQRQLLAALQFTTLAASVVALGFFLSTTGGRTNAIPLLAAIVALLGIGFLINGILIAEGPFWRRLQDRRAATGLDIMAAILGAFGLATAFADPPLF